MRMKCWLDNLSTIIVEIPSGHESFVDAFITTIASLRGIKGETPEPLIREACPPSIHSIYQT